MVNDNLPDYQTIVDACKDNILFLNYKLFLKLANVVAFINLSIIDLYDSNSVLTASNSVFTPVKVLLPDMVWFVPTLIYGKVGIRAGSKVPSA